MKAAGFVLLAATVPTALAGCSAIAQPKPPLAATLFSKMLARCDNAASPSAIAACQEQMRREYQNWARIHPLE